MTINPGSALLVRTSQQNVLLRVVIDFKREHFWPEFFAQTGIEETKGGIGPNNKKEED